LPKPPLSKNTQFRPTPVLFITADNGWGWGSAAGRPVTLGLARVYIN